MKRSIAVFFPLPFFRWRDAPSGTSIRPRPTRRRRASTPAPNPSAPFRDSSGRFSPTPFLRNTMQKNPDNAVARPFSRWLRWTTFPPSGTPRSAPSAGIWSRPFVPRDGFSFPATRPPATTFSGANTATSTTETASHTSFPSASTTLRPTSTSGPGPMKSPKNRPFSFSRQ